VRALSLVVAGASKAVFIGLVLVHGRQFLSQQAGVSVAVDTLMVVLFAMYLMQARRARLATR
jgi:hypothetical protein